MGNCTNLKKEVLKTKNSGKSKKGIIVLKNVCSNISVSYVQSFLKRYGNIKRSFFFSNIKLENFLIGIVNILP